MKRPREPVGLFTVASDSEDSDEPEQQPPAPAAAPVSVVCAECGGPCASGGGAETDASESYCDRCWESWEGTSSREQVAAVTVPEDLPRDTAWWRCAGCRRFLYSEHHAAGCAHAEIRAVPPERIEEMAGLQPVYDPSTRAGFRPDIEISCADCGTRFCFSAGQQRFFAAQGFKSQPTRCVDCRKLNREQKAERMEQHAAQRAERELARKQHSWEAVAIEARDRAEGLLIG